MEGGSDKHAYKRFAQSVIGVPSGELPVDDSVRPVLMKRIGVRDIFGESGEHDELLVKFGLTANDIARVVRELVKEKKR